MVRIAASVDVGREILDGSVQLESPADENREATRKKRSQLEEMLQLQVGPEQVLRSGFAYC
jgi:hypothetical protein